MNAYPSSIGQLPAPRPSRKGYWQRFGGKFLALSILAHVLFLLGAAYLAVHTFAPPRPALRETLPTMSPDAKAQEQKNDAAKLTSMSAPPAPKIITTTSLASVIMPDVQSAVTDALPVTLMTNGQGLHGYQPGPIGQIGNGIGGNGPFVSKRSWKRQPNDPRRIERDFLRPETYQWPKGFRDDFWQLRRHGKPIRQRQLE